jgi:type III pantothenate kinase
MLLAIDIGNTNISFGVFRGNIIAKKFDILTKGYGFNKLKRQLGNLKISETLICSVVPNATQIIARDLRKITGIRPIIIGKDLTVPIKNLYRYPRQVGQDRLVNAYAGVKISGAPLIIIDSGTAITFDIVSKNKEYLGGMILPGLKMSLDALYEKTALLPKIKLDFPEEFIGRDSKTSILSGIIYGFSTLTQEIVRMVKIKIGTNAKVIGTGGNIKFISKYCKSFDRIDGELTLKGLKFISTKNRKNKGKGQA